MCAAQNHANGGSISGGSPLGKSTVQPAPERGRSASQGNREIGDSHQYVMVMALTECPGFLRNREIGDSHQYVTVMALTACPGFFNLGSRSIPLRLQPCRAGFTHRNFDKPCRSVPPAATALYAGLRRLEIAKCSAPRRSPAKLLPAGTLCAWKRE